MKEPRIGRLLAVVLGLIAVIAPIAAATVTISPDTIQENTPITVSVKDLPDGSTFMIRVEASIPLDSSGKYSLSTNNLQMPFALSGGQIDIRAENVGTANFSARMGGRAVTIFGDAENGVVTINQPGDIPQGLITYITLEGTGAGGAGAVTTAMDLSGRKTGATSADVTFTVNGFGSGSVNVKAYVDGSLVATVPAETPTTTTAPGGSSSGGVDPTPTTQTPDETLTVSSLNGMAVLTFERGALSGAGASDLTVMVSNRAVPEGWTALAGPFAVLPSGATFNPSADFSITMTADERDTSVPYTILGYTGGAWKPLQSRIDGDTITTSIAAAGEYALVMPREETTVTTTAVPTVAVTTATATETTATETTPAAAPLSLLCALGGLAAACLLYRKQT